VQAVEEPGGSDVGDGAAIDLEALRREFRGRADAGVAGVGLLQGTVRLQRVGKLGDRPGVEDREAIGLPEVVLRRPEGVGPGIRCLAAASQVGQVIRLVILKGVTRRPLPLEFFSDKELRRQGVDNEVPVRQNIGCDTPMPLPQETSP